MPLDAFTVMNIVGLVAFAVVGALKAVDSDLDVLGVVILGAVTALGGGTLRDLLVNQVPNSLQSSTDMGVALFGVCLALVGVQFVDGLVDHPIVVVSDAVGLAAFATTGALVGHAAGVSPFGVVILAMSTGVGGGAVADVLRGEVPFVLKEDFYATCAIVGSAAFWVAVTVGVSTQHAAITCAATTLTVRLLAIRREWHLPRTRRALAP